MKLGTDLSSLVPAPKSLLGRLGVRKAFVAAGKRPSVRSVIVSAPMMSKARLEAEQGRPLKPVEVRRIRGGKRFLADYLKQKLRLDPRLGDPSTYRPDFWEYTDQVVWPGSYAARILRILGSPEYELYGTVPHNAQEIIEGVREAVLEGGLPSHIVLRRIFDTFHHKIVIAPVGFRWEGDTKDTIFDSKPAITPEFLRQRAHDRVAYANG